MLLDKDKLFSRESNINTQYALNNGKQQVSSIRSLSTSHSLRQACGGSSTHHKCTHMSLFGDVKKFEYIAESVVS